MRIFSHVALGVVFLALLAGSLLVADGGSVILTETAEITTTPGAERFGVLLAGSPVRVLEARDGWMRVSVEGWIPADGATAAPAAPEPRPSPAPAAAAVSLSGSVFVTDRGRTIVGAGIALRLVSDPERIRRKLDESRSACGSRRGALEDEARELKDKASRSLSAIENTTTAFEAYDEAKRRRRAVLASLRSLDQECLSEEESIVESGTVARTLSDPHGGYAFSGVAPGRYLLAAALETEEHREIWQVDVELAAGTSPTIDLTQENRTATEPLPSYR